MRVGESFVSATDGLNLTRERFGGAEPEGSAMSSVGLDAFKQRLADPDGRLSRFFTTSGCYFGPVAERLLDEQPQAWI